MFVFFRFGFNLKRSSASSDKTISLFSCYVIRLAECARSCLQQSLTIAHVGFNLNNEPALLPCVVFSGDVQSDIFS